MLNQSRLKQADEVLAASLERIKESLLTGSDPTKKEQYSLKAVFHARNLIGTAIKRMQTVRLMTQDIDSTVKQLKVIYKDLEPEYFK